TVTGVHTCALLIFRVRGVFWQGGDARGRRTTRNGCRTSLPVYRGAARAYTHAPAPTGLRDHRTPRRHPPVSAEPSRAAGPGTAQAVPDPCAATGTRRKARPHRRRWVWPAPTPARGTPGPAFRPRTHR